MKAEVQNPNQDDQINNDKPAMIFLVSMIIISIVVLGGMFYMTSSRGGTNTSESRSAATISTEGKQVIEITAKGGYTPSEITAKADTASVLKITTKNTFDCSLALRIPTLNVKKTLPMSGDTLFEIPPQKTGSEIKGICSMGMYYFTVKFI